MFESFGQVFFCMIHSMVEFLPVSSSSFFVLLSGLISHKYIGSLHLPCAIASTVWFAPDILDEIKSLKKWFFYGIATLLPVITGFIISYYNIQLPETLFTRLIFNFISFIFFITSLFFSSNKKFQYSILDGFIVGILQSYAILLPGSSRMSSVLSFLNIEGLPFSESFFITVILSIPLNFGAAIMSRCLMPFNHLILCTLVSLFALLLINKFSEKFIFTSIIIRLILIFAIFYEVFIK